MAHGLAVGEPIIYMEPGLYSRHWNSLKKIRQQSYIRRAVSHGLKKSRMKMVVGERVTKVIMHQNIKRPYPSTSFQTAWSLLAIT